MNYFKDYTQKIRKLSLEVVNIIIGDNISPKLNHYIQILSNLKIKHDAYQEYYGEVKKIVNSFIIHWTEIMNRAIKDADQFSKIVDKDEIINFVDKTIELQKIKQITFEQCFLPVTSPEEKIAYDEILVLYDNYLVELEEKKSAVGKMRDVKDIEDFVKEQKSISLRKKNNSFFFTHTYIATMLLNYMGNIRISLEEIELRVRNNSRRMHQKRDEELNSMLNELYNKNKEHLAFSRKIKRNSTEIAEVQDCLEKLKKKIENHKEVILTRLEEESDYWKGKLKEFNQISKTVNDLKEVEKRVLEQQQSFLQSRNAEVPKTNRRCCDRLENVISKKLQILEEKRREAGRALITFFSVRGPDHVFYNDSIGRCYLDEHGHKVYSYDFDLNMYHVNCDGDLYKAPDTEAYFYDNNGRYIYDENGEKLYKIAPCTSSYRLVDDIMTKCTKDCGHSEQLNENCRMDIRNNYKQQYLPDTKPVDIKGLLTSETTLYLWESFGHVLPEVLTELANEHPNNPIHRLAHKLLAFKYNKTIKEMEKKKEEAREYRDAIYRDRKEKAIAASKAWKAKQVKRRKPEESDDTDGRAYSTYIAHQEFINALSNIYGLQ